MQDDDFATLLLNKVKGNVTLGDIFGDVEGTPLSLLDPTTKIGEINEELKEVFKTSTAGEMYDAGILPFDASTIEEMDGIFGKLIMIDIMSTTPGDEFDRIDPIFDGAISDALDAHDINNYGTQEEYEIAVGHTFWMSLTATELVKVLLGAVNLS